MVELGKLSSHALELEPPGPVLAERNGISESRRIQDSWAATASMLASAPSELDEARPFETKFRKPGQDHLEAAVATSMPRPDHQAIRKHANYGDGRYPRDTRRRACLRRLGLAEWRLAHHDDDAAGTGRLRICTASPISQATTNLARNKGPSAFPDPDGPRNAPL